MVLAVALMLAPGLCLLDRDGDGISDDGMDMCVAHTVAIIAIEVVVVTTQVGWWTPSAACSIPTVMLSSPDPPPKALLVL